MGWRYQEAARQCTVEGPARATLFVLAYFASDTTGATTATRAAISEATGFSLATTKRHLRQLRDKCKVIREGRQRRLPGGRWSPVERRILLPIPPAKSNNTGGHGDPRHRGSKRPITGGHGDPLTYLTLKAAGPDGPPPLKNPDRGL